MVIADSIGINEIRSKIDRKHFELASVRYAGMMPVFIQSGDVRVEVSVLEEAIDDVLERTLNAPRGPAAQKTIWAGLRMDYGHAWAQAYHSWIGLRREMRGLLTA